MSQVKSVIIALLLLVPPAVNAVQQFSFNDVLEAEQRPPDAIIAYGDHAAQKLYLWQGQAQKPAIFFIHGGCWLSQYSVAHSYPLTTALNAEGYTVYAAEYRRSGDTGGGWPTSLDDLVIAFNHATAHAPQQRFIVSGHSAGGHLALLLAAQPKLQNQIERTIGLAAITDLPSYANAEGSCQQAAVAFMGGTPAQLPTQYKIANPASKSHLGNVVTLQGNEDTIVPTAAAQQIDSARPVLIDNAGHFDLIHPKSTAFQALLDVLQEPSHDLKK